MLLYDGYTFTQNRMCKDGMRWQCSFPKCKAFCRMSSAGWLTPHRTNHEHPKPSDEEIRKRILRMEVKIFSRLPALSFPQKSFFPFFLFSAFTHGLCLQLKARAQSSGATPGEIIRNALPAEEYQTTDQRACYTRCIQRFRKSLQRKNSKPAEDVWQGKTNGSNSQKPEVGDDSGWKPMMPSSDLAKSEVKHWQGHSERVNMNESEKHEQMIDQKDVVQEKVGLYRI